MKKYIWLICCTTVLLYGCKKTEDEQAKALLSTIEQLYHQKKYSDTLDSIIVLRTKYPQAIACRKAALTIWQKASLQQAQQDIARTDSALQAILRAIPLETNLYKANMMRAKRDSLQARYEAMCGVVKMIRMRQKQQ